MAPGLLVIRPGCVYPEIASGHGDFDQWFRVALGAAADLRTVVDPTERELPSARGFDGCLVTGSLASVQVPSDWLAALRRWIEATLSDGVPLLGVCYGHQLIAQALGGRVASSPHRRIMGSVPVELTDAGTRHAMFAGMPRAFPAAFSHHDEVVELPAGAERLASSSPVATAAYAVGSAWAVQFHPEMSTAARRAIRVLDTGTPIGWAGGDESTEASRGVLLNFASHCEA